MIQRMRATVGCLVVLSIAGCAHMGPLPKAGRTPAQREQLVKPGTFGEQGKGAAADVRRAFFDFWNEQVIREDVAVSTVFMGDSITELWNLPVYFQASDGIIQNRGISGDLAAHMARRFEADVIQLKPRNVVILAGTNDVARHLGANRPDPEIIADVTANVTKMMDAARAAGIHTLVCSILPTNADYRLHEGKKRILPAINEKLKAACREKGCIWVDCWSHMTDANGDLRKDLARDGLHPHYAGYEIMARLVKEAARTNGLRL